jgi:hypothetical protein
MKGKCCREIIIFSFIMVTVNLLGTKSILAWDDFNFQKVKINHPLNSFNPAMIRSENPRNLEAWQVSARGEVTEDCLLYGICSDNKKDQ